jgi:hypothetical protein
MWLANSLLKTWSLIRLDTWTLTTQVRFDYLNWAMWVSALDSRHHRFQEEKRTHIIVFCSANMFSMLIIVTFGFSRMTCIRVLWFWGLVHGNRILTETMVSDHPPGRQSSEGVPFDIPSCILLFGVYKIETKKRRISHSVDIKSSRTPLTLIHPTHFVHTLKTTKSFSKNTIQTF